tara:strand:+ start:239 stop:634 length:396 start_codon:yes stop_codon:yes gene_type:complete
MLNLFLLTVIPFIIYSLYPILNTTIIRNNKNKLKNSCYNPMVRQDICLNNKKDLCPISSYKQCTNNHYPINKCDCFERSFELCNKNDQFSEKCYHNKINNNPDLNIIRNNSSSNNRVNIYNSQKTIHDFLK